jgi:hypothetical protein
MKKETFLKKAVAGLGSAALVIAMSACAHHTSTADQGYGQIRPEGSATNSGDTTAVAVAAPANAEGMSGTTTPAVIPGPAAVDSTGRAYTSSSVGSAGNASNVGTNTNVNMVPKKVKSDVTVTQSAATIETPSTTETTVVTQTPTPIIAETPAPVIVETPAPAPVVETPMASSTTETTTTTTETPKHRRMRKD